MLWNKKILKNKGFYIVLILFILSLSFTAYWIFKNQKKPKGTDEAKIVQETPVDNEDKSYIQETMKEDQPKIVVKDVESKSPQQVQKPFSSKTAKTSAKNSESQATVVLLKPLEGDISMDYSSDTLVYSRTLKEWTTHYGIDIQAAEGTPVKAAISGTVEKIYKDPRIGNTVVISNGKIKTIYGNLRDGIKLNQGQTVKAGDIVGEVGTSANFEIEDPPHLHFELLIDGKHADPKKYFK